MARKFDNGYYSDPALKPWLMGMRRGDFRDKESLIRSHIRYMFSRTAQMFKYGALPETIPAFIYEQMMQGNAHCIIAERPDNIYAFTGGLGGEPDVYYEATEYIVSNPGLNFSKTFTIGKDCVLCRNDHMLNGLMPLHRRYATLLAENELSFYVAEVNSRLQYLINGSTDADKLTADNLIKALESGELHSVNSPEFTGGIQLQPGGQYAAQTLQEIIEAEQYIKASWYNELGLDANYNMKRESINSNESQLNDDMLHPLIDDMLAMRREALEKVNEMFGTNITVEFNSAWADNETENELTMEVMEAEADQITEAPEETDNIEAAPEEKEVLIDETEKEETAEKIPAEEEVTEEVKEEEQETDILPEAVEELTAAVTELTEAITADEPEETKEGEE